MQDILQDFSDPLGLAIDLTTDLEQELVMPGIADVKRKYLWLYDESLEAAITKATSGVFGFMLLSISTCRALPQAVGTALMVARGGRGLWPSIGSRRPRRARRHVLSRAGDGRQEEWPQDHGAPGHTLAA